MQIACHLKNGEQNVSEEAVSWNLIMKSRQSHIWSHCFACNWLFILKEEKWFGLPYFSYFFFKFYNTLLKLYSIFKNFYFSYIIFMFLNIVLYFNVIWNLTSKLYCSIKYELLCSISQNPSYPDLTSLCLLNLRGYMFVYIHMHTCLTHSLRVVLFRCFTLLAMHLLFSLHLSKSSCYQGDPFLWRFAKSQVINPHTHPHTDTPCRILPFILLATFLPFIGLLSFPPLIRETFVSVIFVFWTTLVLPLFTFIIIIFATHILTLNGGKCRGY